MTVLRPRRRDAERKTGRVFVIHGTKKFRDRVPPTDAPASEVASTTALGDWYATILFWRPQVALFVNERTLLPVLMPFGPGASTLERFCTSTDARSDCPYAARLCPSRPVRTG